MKKKAGNKAKAPKPLIGWREWVGLPDLGIERIKAKIDTGARSCTLHAIDVRIVRRRGVDVVRFKVHPIQRNTHKTVRGEAPLLEERTVRSSSGHETVRPVIETTLELMGQRQTIELTLVNRDEMGFRMLLGRQALRPFHIDAARSYLAGKRLSATRPAAKPRK